MLLAISLYYFIIFGFLGAHYGSKRTMGGYAGMFWGWMLGPLGCLIVVSSKKIS